MLVFVVVLAEILLETTVDWSLACPSSVLPLLTRFTLKRPFLVRELVEHVEETISEEGRPEVMLNRPLTELLLDSEYPTEA